MIHESVFKLIINFIFNVIMMFETIKRTNFINNNVKLSIGKFVLFYLKLQSGSETIKDQCTMIIL